MSQLELLTHPLVLLQLLILLIVVLCAIALGRVLRRSAGAKQIAVTSGASNRFLEALVITSPHAISLILTAACAGVMHALHYQPDLLDTAISLIALLLLVRVIVYVFRISVGNRAPIKGWGNTISLIIWTVLALHVLGWFDPVVLALDRIGIQVGTSRISVWSVVKLLFTVGLFVLAAVWVARWIERRLMTMSAVGINMRIGLAKFIQAGLIGISVLVGLNAAGLDLTTLNVLTGAIGIGLGFGLQSIAANFVSGFVLLMDRSIKPGDVISFSGTSGTTTEAFGWVQELRGRYVVVRDRDGIETLVPNQHLITNPVINWSYTDPRIRLRLPVRVSYDSDPELALSLMAEATRNHPRILQEPLPVSRMMAFGDYGFELELRFWITDPQEGMFNVRSDVNRTIWRLFKENGVVIPVPQHEVKVKSPSRNVIEE
ncbi:MAG TPA: mechanosensitive ion channel domain-containing protein [Steroidobacteraceae bacterium]|nr:mechanosensitive ion channel domain-containing protein [Steroidobacteraceae bacterium]